MENYEVNPNFVLAAYAERVTSLSNEVIVRDALIKQLSQRVLELEDQLTKKEDSNVE